MKPFLLLLAFYSAPSLAATERFCTAPFDEGSRYELRFVVERDGVKGPAELRYVTSDGLDLRAEMKVSSFHAGADSLSLTAQNESMGVQLDTRRDGGRQAGSLRISFSLDHAESVELAAECL